MEWLNLREEIIRKNDYKKIEEVRNFLLKEGLRYDKSLEYTTALYDDNRIVGTASIEGKVLKCIAVDNEYKGMGITNKLITNLINEQYSRGRYHLFIFTKPENKHIFRDLGFYEIAEVSEKVILFENDLRGIKKFTEKLSKKKVDGKIVSSIVVNCNPFTLGHRYLIEKASKESDVVHVFVVTEDKSIFPADIRFKLVEEGKKDFGNVILHKGEEYIISSATFPSYFLKKQDEAVKLHTLLDIEIFIKYIVPALGINRRYVGEEPFCEVTKVYNSTMKELLPASGVEVVEVPRIFIGDSAVSASRVRNLIKEDNFTELKTLVPGTTYNFLMSEEAETIINKIKEL
ncbi:[citrate (pro-3S)-lyase] ligase [Clostridium sp. YIM B02515]|uniref:[Citrate [pro-3S]-lyase] ligase n=1 Tax=Clostridium rhizosphaerae TaxID=2803861 RepID=A0ABS1THG3_9CLOT|nr:[citrate (pro-3S)-lyase] ligase [Clostridium rhizosphaerae]MBL4938227.1 [citrate (pro-3S)-lyase] ligase [Clostridium rhizosphaerae]